MIDPLAKSSLSNGSLTLILNLNRIYYRLMKCNHFPVHSV